MYKQTILSVMSAGAVWSAWGRRNVCALLGKLREGEMIYFLQVRGYCPS